MPEKLWRSIRSGKGQPQSEGDERGVGVGGRTDPLPCSRTPPVCPPVPGYLHAYLTVAGAPHDAGVVASDPPYDHFQSVYASASLARAATIARIIRIPRQRLAYHSLGNCGCGVKGWCR